MEGMPKSPWDVKEGSLYRSILTEGIYKVSKVTDFMAVLDSLDGKNKILTEVANLEIFYKPWDASGIGQSRV